MTPLFSGAVFCASGRSTWEAASMVTEVVTMKMMSRTRKMSVSGVMFICQNISPELLGPLTANGLSPLQRGVDETGGVDVDGGVDIVDLHREVVVENDRDDRDRQSQCGRNQRLRNARRHHRETAGAHHRHRLERGQNADHGAEQPDERSRGARRCEHPDVTLELDQLGEAPLLVEFLQPRAIEVLGARDERMEDAVGGGMAGLGALQGLVELALAPRTYQRVGGLGGAGPDAAQSPQALEDNRQANDRDEDQRVRSVVALLDHLNNAELVLHRLTFRSRKFQTGRRGRCASPATRRWP